MSDVTLLSVSCCGLSVVNFGTKGSGFMSRMYQRATSSSDKTSADLRWITISQSKPFPIDGTAPGFNYDTVYKSETFSDLGAQDGIYSHLVASIKCPVDMDCNIRINVYIESVNLNSGSSIVLGGCTFSRRDLLGFDSKEKVTYSTKLTSEFCMNAKVFINVVDQMDAVGANNSIIPFAPVRKTGSAADRGQPVGISLDLFKHSNDVFLTKYALFPSVSVNF